MCCQNAERTSGEVVGTNALAAEGFPAIDRLQEVQETFDRVKKDEAAAKESEDRQAAKLAEAIAKADNQAAPAPAPIEPAEPMKEEKLEEKLEDKAMEQKLVQEEKGWRRRDIVITRASSAEKLGIDVVVQKSVLVVTSVGAGIVDEWNKKAEDGSKIGPGTVLERVNGATESSATITNFSKDCKLECSVKRYMGTITATFEGKDLGLDLDTSTMIVKSVLTNGLLGRYNDSCEVGLEILSGDRMLHVNGKTESLVKELRDGRR